jgi:hypothetical protein
VTVALPCSIVPTLQLDKAAADAAEYKAGYDKLMVDTSEQKAQLDKAAADASEYKAGFDKAAADAAEYKAGYDKVLVDTTEHRALVSCWGQAWCGLSCAAAVLSGLSKKKLLGSCVPAASSVAVARQVYSQPAVACRVLGFPPCFTDRQAVC